MWPTTHGTRQLSGDEAALVRGVIGTMVDQLVGEGHQKREQYRYHIDWFDNWDYSQRLWLLDCVATALLTTSTPPQPAAMFEATVDAIFAELFDLISIEINYEVGNKKKYRKSWRQSTIDAFITQNDRSPDVHPDDSDESMWSGLVVQIADVILGVRIYQQAESFRDGDPAQTQKFLQQKGVPSDFLQRIPPLLNVHETQIAVDQIQRLVLQK